MFSVLKRSKVNPANEQVPNGLNDYNVYIMSSREKVFYTLLAASLIFIVGYTFYHSIILSMLISLLSLFYPRIRTAAIIKNRKSQLNLQFKEMLYSLSSSLSAGKSVESAFKEVLKDLSVSYPAPNTFIIKEVEYIVRKIEMNETIESAISDFAKRSHLEDVESFSDVFQICKRSGGNIVEVIKNTSNIINDKIEIKNEIDTLLSSRRFEQKILNAMPVLIILFLSVSAADYIAPIFNTIAGRVSMTVSIALLGAAYFISKKIMDINV
jgi:tight adherence protein B